MQVHTIFFLVLNLLFIGACAQAHVKKAAQKNSVSSTTNKNNFVAGPIKANNYTKARPIGTSGSCVVLANPVLANPIITARRTASSTVGKAGKNSLHKKQKKPVPKNSGLKNSSIKQLKQCITLQWPIDEPAYWISSPYGPRKNVDGSTGFHTGLDLAAVKGTPIMATNDGVVLEVSLVEDPQDRKGYGNMILLVHKSSNGTHFKTRYAHCDKVLVQRGQRVSKGETIATVGNTGNVRRSAGGDGSHLHLELYIGKKRVNPFYFLAKKTKRTTK